MKKIFMRQISTILVLALVLCAVVIPTTAATDPTDYKAYTAPSASDYAYWSGSSVVKASGTTTSEIKWMQAALNYCKKYKGLALSEYLSIDGSFGPVSRAATLVFQKKYALMQDGSFGPNTAAKMKEVLAAPNNPVPTPSVTASKTLSIKWDLIKKTGTQSVSGPCYCFALAYARDIIDGKVHYWTEYRASSGSYAADRSKAGFTAKYTTSKTTAFKDIYNKVKSGQPVVINVNGGRSTGEHFVCVVGFKNVTSVEKLSESNFLIIDSATSYKGTPENLGSVGYKLKYNSGQGYYYAYKA